jgi:catechol 2,3-dioxygenase-like lactoylglutathione lyase family enzyme
MSGASFAQNNAVPSLDASFFALIIEDLDTSINWYSDVLGFNLIQKNEFTESGFSQANLHQSNTSLELIQLQSAISLKENLPNYTSKTRVHGIFKIGFTLAEFDIRIAHLKEKEVEFHGNIVRDKLSGKRMVIIKDPDGNKIQLFELCAFHQNWTFL